MPNSGSSAPSPWCSEWWGYSGSVGPSTCCSASLRGWVEVKLEEKVMIDGQIHGEQLLINYLPITVNGYWNWMSPLMNSSCPMMSLPCLLLWHIRPTYGMLMRWEGSCEFRVRTVWSTNSAFETYVNKQTDQIGNIIPNESRKNDVSNLIAGIAIEAPPSTQPPEACHVALAAQWLELGLWRS